MSAPSQENTPARPAGGLISLFARHRTAANLLMAGMMIIGLFALKEMNTQFFPDFGLDMVRVTVNWPGASAEDVDSNIVQAIEPEIRFLDDVKRVQSRSREGFATIVIEYNPNTDMQAALSNVETAVGQITTFPEDSETPTVSRIVRYDAVSRLVISGPYSDASLKAVAKRIRDGLLERGIDKVTMAGQRDEEIWAEIPQERLLELDLTLGDVASRIKETSQDLPSGDTTGPSERQIRSLGLKKDAQSLGKIEIRAQEDGQKILLQDIAEVSERFEEGGHTKRRLGNNAIELFVQRAVNADALTVADATDKYLEELSQTLPENIKIEQFQVAAKLIRGRIGLLLENGATGLVLVLVVLFIFLNTPTAFWVAMGIPVSLLATMAVMWGSDQSINMVSLFGLILALGIIVDDAIVVGEHAAWRARRGESPDDAAVNGARRMAGPVVSSSLTTIAAFLPLLVISGIIGQIIASIPFVVIAVIIASLIECFFILPGHMRGALNFVHGRRSAPRVWFNKHFDRFRDGPFRRAVETALEWRYATLACAVAGLIIAFGLLAGGRVGFHFFPQPETDVVHVNIEFPDGTPRDTTVAMLDEIERAALAVDKQLTNGGDTVVAMTLLTIGTNVGAQQGSDLRFGDYLGGLTLELIESDKRDVRTVQFIEAWREEIKPLPGLTKISLREQQGGPPGREIDIHLSGTDLQALKETSEDVQALLNRYPGVSDVEDDLPYGKIESILEVSPDGRALGFNTQSVGRQVRNAFEGAIATRFARGDEEVTVRVRFPRGTAETESLDGLYLRSPGGAHVSLDQVVSFSEKRGFSTIKRENGSRQASITGEIDEAQNTSTGKVIDLLKEDGIVELAAKNGVTVSFAGKAEEQEQTLGDMRTGAIIGLCMIYIILAWVFASYFRPIAVMAIIPFGLIGVIFGHYLLGYEFSILSIMAIIGLSGVVVNDSIILVSTIDERAGNGEPIHDAIVQGTCDRLRAVILTSATTMGGLTPMLFEKSLQAQFIIPMAVTMVFGLMVTTFLVLLVVPALIGIQGDFANAWQWYWGKKKAVSPAAAE